MLYLSTVLFVAILAIIAGHWVLWWLIFESSSSEEIEDDLLIEEDLAIVLIQDN